MAQGSRSLPSYRRRQVSAMKERVARALADMGEGEPITDGVWATTNRAYWGAYAQAAIEAMRDPPPLELYPGVHAYIVVENSCRPVAFRAGWNAVIDAALAEAAQ
jgi:hypothetical protein